LAKNDVAETPMPYGALKREYWVTVPITLWVAETPMPYGALKHCGPACVGMLIEWWRKRQCPTGH